jgi:CopG family nickel-responsive transcriptional regulator
MEKDLTDRLEALVQESRYTNRSEFIRDLVREKLVETVWKRNEEVLGTITLVYDHEKRELSQKLVSIQHHHHRGDVLAATHVHLDEHLCAEMIMVRGKASDIRALADLMRAQKGVLHAALSMSAAAPKPGARRLGARTAQPCLRTPLNR